MIDSSKIISEIRNELNNTAISDVLSFDSIPMPSEVSYMGAEIADFDLGDLMESNEYINKHYLVSVWHPTWSARPVIGPIIVFFQRIMRKLMRFFVQPIVEDQNSFNMNCVRSMNQVRNYIYYDHDIINDKIELIRTLIRQTDMLEKRVLDLEEINKKLREGKK